MAENTQLSSTPTIRTRRPYEKSPKNTKYSFRIQSAPPLSIQQFLRSSSGLPTGDKRWRPSGKYHEPIFNKYLTREVRPREKIAEPVWRPPSPYKDERPTSLSPEKRKVERIKEPTWQPPGPYRDKPPSSFSPEKRPQQSITEPVWRPAGKAEHKPVPYFEPNLRWSLQELLRSMPEMRPQTFRSSSSMSKTRKSVVIEDT
ncbi:hypothetical protein I4U23_018457 [Adineta vaga]|nr:hypothetical protein I4U23_018457 [Adineta vaga]